MFNPFRQSGMIRAMSLQSATDVEDSVRLATTGFCSNNIKCYLLCQAGASAILNRLCLARRSAQPRWAVAFGLPSIDCPDIEVGHWQLGAVLWPMHGLCRAAGGGWNHLVLGSGNRRALWSGLRADGRRPSRQHCRWSFPLLTASPVTCVRRSPSDDQAARCTGSVAARRGRML